MGKFFLSKFRKNFEQYWEYLQNLKSTMVKPLRSADHKDWKTGSGIMKLSISTDFI